MRTAEESSPNLLLPEIGNVESFQFPIGIMEKKMDHGNYYMAYIGYILGTEKMLQHLTFDLTSQKHPILTQFIPSSASTEHRPQNTYPYLTNEKNHQLKPEMLHFSPKRKTAPIPQGPNLQAML